MDFKIIDNKYRPIPFWSWNDRLDAEETRRQVRIMNEAGIGGYFMHARGGLTTEYMGDEWFDNVKAAADEGAKCGMYSWAYDENGWPSGFGGGKVNGLGLEYQQKSVHIEDAKEGCESLPETLLVRGGKRYFYRVNPFYVDTLSKKVMRRFIDEIYAEYEKRCGSTVAGFFTDEPQIIRDTGYPWSFELEDAFAARYGYSITENLDKLFLDLEGAKEIRLDYWQLVTEMFSEAYFRQIYEWCDERGYMFTGHLVLEDTVSSQIVSNGSCMPHYEYFHIPGIDWLGRPIDDFLGAVQVGSAAAQTGKKQVLAEDFALSGHNVSHAELKRIFEWQMVKGVNLLCTHLEGYSLKGIRKRDYPPAVYYQQPWWEETKVFFDTVSRIGMLLAEGEVVADTLLLNRVTEAWVRYDGWETGTDSLPRIEEIDRSSYRDIRILDDKHVLYHIGDETLIRRHGRVEGGKFIVGKMAYTTLVVSPDMTYLPYTEELIAEFKRQGGRVMTVDEVPASDVCEKNRLSYTKRKFPDFDLHYFVNSDNTTVSANINVGNLILDYVSGDVYPFSGKHTFGPYESIILIDDHEVRRAAEEKPAPEPLSLLGQWQVVGATPNSMTLDRCDYSFDGVLMAKDAYVLDILPRINELRRPVELEQTFRFEAEYIPDDLCLAIEAPEMFEIEINGKRVEKKDAGYFRDKSFRMIPIASYIQVGTNRIVLKSTVSQSDACYRHLDNSWDFENMKNCLWYDTEIEPIYLVGGFGLRIEGEVEELALDAYRVSAAPTVVEPKKTVDVSRLDFDGYSQFAGELVLERTVNLTDTNRSVRLVGRGMNSISLSVNGREVATKLFPPYDADISEYLTEGENTLRLTILNNLRNMMGPHHMKMGECTYVCPGSFYRESNIFDHPAGADGSCHDVLPDWDDGYCFVHFGI